KGQDRAVADELHEIQQRLGRFTSRGQLAGCDTVYQHALAELLVGAPQRAFELLAQVDSALVDDHRAYRQHDIAAGIQAAGFQVQHDHALLLEWAVVQRGRGRQSVTTLNLFEIQQGAPRF